MTFADLDGDELWSYLQERSGLPGAARELEHEREVRARAGQS